MFVVFFFLFTAPKRKRAHLRVPALQTPPKFHEKTPRQSENGSGRGKKKARNFGPPDFGPPPFGPPRCGAPPFGPPLLQAPPFGPPSLRAEALRASTFSISEPLRSSFFHVAHLFFFCAFLIVSISCHFCFFFFYIFHFSSWRGGGGGGKPKPQTSFQFGGGGGGGGYYPPNPNPPPPLKPVSAAACCCELLFQLCLCRLLVGCWRFDQRRSISI